jgi:hypothetical protein
VRENTIKKILAIIIIGNMETSSKKLPYDVAEIVFNNPPGEPSSYQLYCETDTGSKVAPLDLFEIFLTIMMEGMFIINKIITPDTLKLFDENTIILLRPWLHSLGYNVNIEAIPKQDTCRYDTYYCKVILRADPSWNQYFELHENELTRDYHCIFGGNSPYIKQGECSFDNLFAIFTLNNMVYKISFNFNVT